MGCGASVASAPVDAGADRPDAPDAPDAPPMCSFEGAARVSIGYTGPGGVAMDCSAMRPTPGPMPEIVTRTAAVVAVTDDEQGAELTLDFCSPAADCVPLMGRLRINAPGFNLGATPVGLRRGQYVRVRSRATWSWGCTMQVEVSNAPSWDGVANPVRHDSALLAAAANGEPVALPEAPFGVSRQSIGCTMAGTNCGGGTPELFALSVQGHCNTCETDPPPVTVRQGRSEVFGIDGLSYSARNHRSYNTGYCDDYWNYAWTVRERWLE